MPNRKFTINQKKAINVKNKNTLVSAAAGSGKTAVLIERIINKIIKDKIDINTLLVVTFTDMSAREMKQRIDNKLSEELSKNPNDAFLLKQKNLLSIANISTIHGFCSKLIRSNFNLCDVDPNFNVLDSKEADMIKETIITNMFDNLYASNELFLDLIEIFGDKILDEGFKDIILNIYKNAINNPFPIKWLDKSLENYNVDEENLYKNFWIEKIVQECSNLLDFSLKKVKVAKELCKEPNGPYIYLDVLDYDEEIIKTLYEQVNNEGFFDIDFEYAFKRLPSKKKDDVIDEDILNSVKNIRDTYKGTLSDIKKNYFSKTKEMFIEDSNQSKFLIGEIVKIVKDFFNTYQEEKKKLSVLDYNDLEQLTIQLLINENSDENNIIPTNLALEIRNKYNEILIDEYQDCNMIQESIFKCISRGNNLFMVGDVKQSIYGFRHAQPSLFIDKFNTYGESDEDEKIILSNNFRSRKNILDGTNFVFEQIMTSKIGGIEYNEDVKLKLPDNYEDNEIDDNNINIIINDMKNIDDKTISKYELEGISLSNSIKELVDDKNPSYIYDKGNGKREVEYRDIAILTRNSTNVKEITKVLKENNIPFVGSGKTNFYNSIEIQLIICFLQTIDNHLNDIPLISILSSPIYSLSNDELLEIKSKNDIYFYDKINSYINDNNNDLSSKLEKFKTDLIKLIDNSKVLKISELITEILNHTNIVNYIKTLENAKMRESNIKTLLNSAIEYENTNYTTLFNFINYIEQLKTNSSLTDEPLTISENENAVRILTIHKSKGLEFPIVYVSFLSSQFNTQDEKQQITIHNNMGLSCKNTNLKYRIETNTYQRIISNKIKRKELIAEELRLLYVAMTRAENKLFFTATTTDLEKDINNVLNIAYNKGNALDYDDILSCKSYYDFIIKTFSRHRDWYNEFNGHFNVLNHKIFNYDINLNIKVIRKIGDLYKTTQLQSTLCDKVNNLKMYNADNIIFDNLNSLSSYEYPYKKDTLVKNKTSISELKRLSQTFNTDIPQMINKPKFIENNKDSKSKGIILHKIIENIDLKTHKTKKDIDDLIESLIKNNILSEENVKIINSKLIYDFIESDLATRMKESSHIEKEKSFVLSIDSTNKFNIDINENSYVLLNGIIDCYFIENGEVVIVDFKSDNFRSQKYFIEKYQLQLNMYKEAIEKSTNYKVKELIIYSLVNRKSIVIKKEV